MLEKPLMSNFVFMLTAPVKEIKSHIKQLC